MYVTLVSTSLMFSLPNLLYMIADSGYQDKKLYEYSKKILRIDLICPVIEGHKSTSKKRLEDVCFYQSALG